MAEWNSIKNRAAGKWQIPLFLVSLALLAFSLMRARPSPQRMPAERAIRFLSDLHAAELFDRAIDFGDGFLTRPDTTAQDRATAHLWVARSWFADAARRQRRTESLAGRIVSHYQQAETLGEALNPEDYVNLARAEEWRKSFTRAVAAYEKALQHGADFGTDLRKHLLLLKLERMEVPLEEAATLIQAFIAELPDDDFRERIWAVERLFHDYLEADRPDEADAWLNRHAGRFTAADLDHRHEYHRFQFLEANLLYARGRFDETERHLRTLRNLVDADEEIHAATGWLLGRVVMSDGGPQRPLEAVSFFQDVIDNHPGSTYAVASRVGLAEALAAMERDEEAVQAFRIAIEEMKEYQPSRVADRRVLRTRLGLLSEIQRQDGRFDHAARYAKLAVELLDPTDVQEGTPLLEQLGLVQFLRAEELASEVEAVDGAEGVGDSAFAQAQVMFAEAAETHLRIAKLNALNDARVADATWQAAELYVRGGEELRASELFEAFVRERPQHPQAPRAFLRVGQLRRTAGALAGAIEAFRQCYVRFPSTLDGARALVPLARCYFTLGTGYEDLAEKTLRIVLEDSEVFTPQAPDFAEALFLLGELLHRRNEFERAIPTLEEAMERYADDPRVPKARFLLAESYRQSALGLRSRVRETGLSLQTRQITTDSTERLRTARELYRRLIDELEMGDPARLSGRDATLLRLAYLYEADCYFEAQEYPRALKLYEEAANKYQDTVHALASCVQIINSYVFLGQAEEARAVLARTLVLVEVIPDAAFDRTLSSETREDWKRYFQWLGQSELF